MSINETRKMMIETEKRNRLLQRLYAERIEQAHQHDIENGIDPTFIFEDEEQPD